MGTRLWLPVGTPPHPFPNSERDELMNRLWNARYHVPGADRLEIQQLRDYVAYAEERTRQELARRSRIAQPPNTMDRNQVREALKAYLAWRRKRRGG